MQPVSRAREASWLSVEDEVRSEQANSLGRVGGRLEALIDQLTGLEQQLASVKGPARRPLVKAHAELRKQAELYLWYLTVQREAMGIKLHSDLEYFYPIPRAIRD